MTKRKSSCSIGNVTHKQSLTRKSFHNQASEQEAHTWGPTMPMLSKLSVETNEDKQINQVKFLD
jgi:hypothetical protein